VLHETKQRITSRSPWKNAEARSLVFRGCGWDSLEIAGLLSGAFANAGSTNLRHSRWEAAILQVSPETDLKVSAGHPIPSASFVRILIVLQINPWRN
jgi:hypothetical protein